ncbi:MAG TPA: PC4/YdbC family ssDNA-binding protein [Clostridia bacterium]|mgnify:FL=1|jgi:hypothetical protein|nr:hypothetical protein [Clostridiaceae bacterium]HOF26675.1 PC4/YdbC family ssDNA-binding protein [Clostridia bacterium]HOM34148.1 PC4/YdbC family ssDNA-binding protein [Clostridia bacterium]HOR89813.1 PC4/YdbC family ssDNA-binding protein [Clostridia bacterium]HOT71467.1 PC4/YdbC family ssDNA-binding protein [Clostridia bacterium]
MAEISYKIEKEIGVLSEAPSGWTRQINLVSWNGREAKLEIRDWAPNRERAGRGMTFTKDEVRKLVKFLIKAELDK